MAHMIPAAISVETKSEGEKKVFRRIRDTLSDDITVFHSYDILSRNMKGKLVEGEIDFLLLFPDMGILILEVKGGVIAYDGNSKVWFQNGKELEKSPYEQARYYKRKIKKYLEQRKCSCKSSLEFGHCVSFPDVYEDVAILTADADQIITITGQHLKYIDKAIPTIMEHFSRNEKTRRLSRDQTLRVKSILAPIFEYGTSICSSISIEDQKIFSLTEEQCRLLNFLGDRKRILIEGCAGSGKTIMAIKKAQQFASQGKKVLFLTFNKLIASQIRNTLEKYEDKIEVSHYHAFCVQKLQEAGETIDFSRHDEPDFWQEEVPNLFSELITHSPIQYDAIIIDEGQDFYIDYWCTIESLLTPDGYLYIFYDPEQNLYDSQMVFPVNEMPFRLTENCRNTKSIFNSIVQHVPESSATVLNESPEGKPVVEFAASSPQEQRKNLGTILHQLLIKEKLPKEKVVVLGGHKLAKTSLAEDAAVGNYVICEKDSSHPNGIQYYTYLSYKGCEADVVILLDVNENDQRWKSPRALYTAKSRAKHLLYILNYTHANN
jgi:thymidylate kinase